MKNMPLRLDIFRTSLPMRRFEHATAVRERAEAVVVRLRDERGREGWGETLPRDYVTGETLETVPRDIEDIFWPALATARSDDDLARAAETMPVEHNGRIVSAARCAVELAVVGMLGVDRVFKPRLGAVRTRVTGVLGSSDPAKTAKWLRLLRWYGVRSFKLKLGLGDDVDRANLQVVHRKLAAGLRQGKVALRVDINGVWPYAETLDRVAELEPLGVCAVEQPCKVRSPRFAELARHAALPLIADESLLTGADAEVLLGAEGKVWFNIRLAKNGGFWPALRLARLAEREGLPYVLGCMVGESGILSLAQRAFLGFAPAPAMMEGSYGPFLLKDDITRLSPRFGYAGRLRPDTIGKFCPNVQGDKLRKHAEHLATLT
jgi:muconate cycloisomerase